MSGAFSHAVIGAVESRRSRSAREVDAPHLRGIAQDGQALHEPAKPGSHFANYRAHPRGVPADGQQKEKHFQNRHHFFGVAAQARHRILVDYARARHAGKRGGGVRPVSLEEAALVSPERAAELDAFDEALKELEELSQRQSREVELRYFGGLSVDGTATVLKVSPATVMRDWNMARTWLHRALGPAGEV